MTAPTINKKLLRDTAAAIVYADRFDLNYYAVLEVGHEDVLASELYENCNTVGCVAGWVCAVSERKVIDVEMYWAAKDALGLTREQADELFLPSSGTRGVGGVWQMVDPYEATAKEAAAVLRGIAAGTRTFYCDRRRAS